MDSSMEMTMGIAFLILALVLIAWLTAVWHSYLKMNRVLNQAHQFTGNVEGTIKKLVQVRHRNRTFRWKNEYPVIAYSVNGKTYETALTFAEKRAGSYHKEDRYKVCYLAEDPGICIVDEFRSQMQSSSKRKLVGIVVLAILTFNVLSYGVSMLFR